MRVITEEEIKICEEFQNLFWRVTYDRFRSAHPFPNPCTQDKLQEVLDIANRNELPAVLGSGVYGQLHISFFKHSTVPGIGPMGMLFSVHQDHFSWPEKTSWDDKFKVFSKIAFSERNIEILKFYGMTVETDPHHYEY